MNQEKKSAGFAPIIQLVLARLRESYRQPEVLFWVYGFPLVMVVGLGTAFRGKPIENFRVDIAVGMRAEEIATTLRKDKRFTVAVLEQDVARNRLRTSKSDLLIKTDGAASLANYEFHLDPTRPKSAMAKDRADDVLQRALGRKDLAKVTTVVMDEPGSRYVDFLVPGMLGMSILGGGMWGVGFATVNLRIRNLLKRFLATPMKKSHFLLAMMISRFLFMVPQMLLLLVFSYFWFDVAIYGNPLLVLFLILLGGFTFSGLGLLVACRAQTMETVSGLMNMVMLPMWMLSGIFFASDKFPKVMQPIIELMPLTPFIRALRDVMLDGASLMSIGNDVCMLVIWGIVTFALALRWFRWT